MSNYLIIDNGRIKEKQPTVVSQGNQSAGEVVALDNTGRLDLSVMPVGIGPDTLTAQASEDLSAGDFVNVWNDSGTVKVRKADASAAGKEADGFVLEATTAGNNTTVYFEGRNTALSGLTPGARYYLSATTPGTVTTTPPTGTGKVVQYIGRAIGETSLAYEATDGVILA